MASFAHTLKNVREIIGLSLESASERTGIDAAELARMETGERQPTDDERRRIVDGFPLIGAPADWIMTER